MLRTKETRFLNLAWPQLPSLIGPDPDSGIQHRADGERKDHQQTEHGEAEAGCCKRICG
jgi:hypothetical protein